VRNSILTAARSCYGSAVIALSTPGLVDGVKSFITSPMVARLDADLAATSLQRRAQHKLTPLLCRIDCVVSF